MPNEAVETPHSGASTCIRPALRETGEPLVVLQVAEHRLDGGEVRGDHPYALSGIDAPLHSLCVRFGVALLAAEHQTDRPSWPTGPRPRGRTPITPPEAARVPLLSIGAARADSMSARVTLSPAQLPDIRLQGINPGKPDYRSVLISLGSPHMNS